MGDESRVFEAVLMRLVADAIADKSLRDKTFILTRMATDDHAITLERFGDEVVVRLYGAPIAVRPLALLSGALLEPPGRLDPLG